MPTVQCLQSAASSPPCPAAPPGPVALAASAPFSFNHVGLRSLHPYTAGVLPGAAVLYDSLVDKYVFLGVTPVDETTSVSHIGSLYYSQNLPCNDLLVPAGRRHQYEATQVTAPCATACGAWLAVSGTEGAAAGSRCSQLRAGDEAGGGGGCSGLSVGCSLLLIELENIFYIRCMSASVKVSL